jgi:uncharacterized membrane protein YadS
MRRRCILPLGPGLAPQRKGGAAKRERTAMAVTGGITDVSGGPVQVERTPGRALLSEDWAAVLIGAAVIAIVLGLFSWRVVDLRQFVPAGSAHYRWTADAQIAAWAPGWVRALDAVSKDAESRRDTKVVEAAKGLKDALATGDRKAIGSAAKKLEGTGKTTVPSALGKEIAGHAGAVAEARVLAWATLSKVLYVGIALAVISAIGIALIGQRAVPFLIAFPVIFILAWLARVLAGNGLFITWGIEYVIFALVLGLLISNTIGVPRWLQPAVQTEFFIKTGLVILGASLLFHQILQAGALGIIQAVGVVFVVWYFCLWLCRKLRVDDEFGAILATAVSICGVSAAIAACGAIQGDKKKLSYVTSLVLIVAVPMMIIMPWIVKSTGMDPLVGGAWLGGTLDTTASVAAAGALVSDAAMKAGVIVKFSQNALVGVAAFLIAIWWAFRPGASSEGPSAGVIWQRFPKFVIGFVAASVVFSFLLPNALVSGTSSVLGDIRLWWFALAFVSIGLETRLVQLAATDQGRPALAFLGAQAFNIVWTLLLAFLLFGGLIFAQPDIR